MGLKRRTELISREDKGIHTFGEGQYGCRIVEAWLEMGSTEWKMDCLLEG